MKLPDKSHSFDVSYKEAAAIQKELAKIVTMKKPAHSLRFVAGLDAAFSPDGKHCIAGVVLWDLEQKCIIEQQTALEPVRFPYIPGFLSFREGPALLSALSKLTGKPDVLMCDGQGIAHPRRFGIACHLGVLTQMPSVGCGKSRLMGTYEEPGKNRGESSTLFYHDEILGLVLRTKNNIKPIFVSVGNSIDLATAAELVMNCFNGYRLPEPTRLADQLVAREKKKCG